MAEQTISELLDSFGRSDSDPREVEAYLKERVPSRDLRELSRSELRVGVSAALLFLGPPSRR